MSSSFYDLECIIVIGRPRCEGSTRMITGASLVPALCSNP